MHFIQLKIFALTHLTKNIEYCENKELLELFIKENDYNPFVEYQELKKDILEDIFTLSKLEGIEEIFNEVSKYNFFDNVEIFTSFEKDIEKNFSHLDKKTFVSIKKFLLNVATKLI